MKWLVFVSLLSLPLLAMPPSGSSGTSAARKGPPSVDPFNATKTMKCVIVQLKSPNLILLEDPETGKQEPYRLANGIRLRAKTKAHFGGRKKLAFEDLAVGQEVKVSINPEKREVLTLKVLDLSPDHT